MGAWPRSWWQQIKTHPVVSVLTAFVIALVVLVILGGYLFHWDWTGFNGNIKSGKTLWDWLQLLIIPAVLAVSGYIINVTISRGEQEATKQRTKTEREIAQDNQHEISLQAYIDKMSELLLHEKLREPTHNDEVRKIARVRTLTILKRLDAERKGSLIQFLYESGLIARGDKCIIDLRGADLSEADLERAQLNAANLCGTQLMGARLLGARLVRADLSGAGLVEADMRFANLHGANLRGANLENAIMGGARLEGACLGAYLNGDREELTHPTVLSGAKLLRAFLNGADLSNAILWGASLFETDLRGADLSGASLNKANLSRADLSRANLRGAWLDEANLSRANVNVEELKKQAKSLKGATMPDGSIHP